MCFTCCSSTTYQEGAYKCVLRVVLFWEGLVFPTRTGYLVSVASFSGRPTLQDVLVPRSYEHSFKHTNIQMHIVYIRVENIQLALPAQSYEWTPLKAPGET